MLFNSNCNKFRIYFCYVFEKLVAPEIQQILNYFSHSFFAFIAQLSSQFMNTNDGEIRPSWTIEVRLSKDSEIFWINLIWIPKSWYTIIRTVLSFMQTKIRSNSLSCKPLFFGAVMSDRKLSPISRWLYWLVVSVEQQSPKCSIWDWEAR